MSHGKDAGSISLFKRAFRFGLRMRFEKSVDAIVEKKCWKLDLHMSKPSKKLQKHSVIFASSRER